MSTCPRRARLPLLVCLLLPFASQAFAAQLVRVPKDARDLPTAISNVSDGGVIELSAGTYATPARGFSIANERKGFTIRATGGAAVLDGGGTNQLLRYENGNRNRGKLVTFEGITFRNGFSETEAYAGGVTLSAAEARFVSCRFENNHATGRTTGGGAVRVLEGSEATFVNTVFQGNSSHNRGGAVEIIVATVVLEGGQVLDNRVNLPGHKAFSSGGGIYLLDSTLRVNGTLFRGNQAGWVGGGIYGFGRWADPVSTPRAVVEVSRATFEANVAGNGLPAPGQTTGGAIHVEDQTRLEIDSSVFKDNVAEFGGAVDSYRASVEIRGSRFLGNRAPLTGAVTGAGGAVFASSVDFADSSTDNGAVNRPSTRLIVSDTLFQGGGVVAHTGGCVLASGDESRVYGVNGVPAAGTLEENRARVELRRTVFADCDVQAASGGGGGSGGGLQADLVDLLVEDSLVLNSGATGGGGGMSIGRDSNAVITRTTFANNSAQRGGGLFLTGANVLVSESNFLGNSVAESRGSAIYSGPVNDPTWPRNIGGLVANSIFSANNGIPVWDNEPPSGPINTMRYNGNQFHLTSGSSAYAHNRHAPGGMSAAELNGFVAGSIDKSDGGNTRLNSAPRLGTVLAVPPFLGAGASGSPSFLAYAWSGRSATLAGQSLGSKAGLVEVNAGGDYALSVDGGPVDSARVSASACTSGPTLCLNADRFKLEVTWKAQGQTGTGKAVSLTSDTGYFWFFNESNIELVVKVLDGRALNGNFWVFYGALSNVEYSLKITDTATGKVKTYNNPAGRLASVGDTAAFPAAKASAQAVVEPAVESAVEPPLELQAAAATCAAGPTDLCLNGSRFRVSLRWKAQGSEGAGQAVPLTSDTGYFWFFGPSNVEVIVKVLDGRGLNGHFWVFYGALTNVEYEITVHDTQTGNSKTYRNPAGRFGSVADTSALPE